MKPPAGHPSANELDFGGGDGLVRLGLPFFSVSFSENEKVVMMILAI